MKVQELINLLQKFDVNHTVRLKIGSEYKNIDDVITGRFVNTVELLNFNDISIEQAEGETMSTMLAKNEISPIREKLIVRAIGQERFDEIRNEITTFFSKQNSEEESVPEVTLVEDIEFDEEADRLSVEKARAEILVEKLYKGEELSDAQLEAVSAAKKLLGKKAVSAIKKAVEKEV
jgi:hypothetical protein